MRRKLSESAGLTSPLTRRRPAGGAAGLDRPAGSVPPAGGARRPPPGPWPPPGWTMTGVVDPPTPFKNFIADSYLLR